MLRRVFRGLFVLAAFGAGIAVDHYVLRPKPAPAHAEACTPVPCIPASTPAHATETPKHDPPRPPTPTEVPGEEECCEKLLRGQTEKERICYPKSYLEPGQKCMLRNGKVLGDKVPEKTEKPAEAPPKAAEPPLDGEAATAKFQKTKLKEIERVLKLFKDDYGLDVLSIDLPQSPPSEFACDEAGVRELTKFGEMFKNSPLNQGQTYFTESIEKIDRVTKWLKDCVEGGSNEPNMSQ